MKYYIDFEATETRHEIISIGCISEDDREFYSLVHSDDPVTPKIEELTGITQEDVDNAPSSTEVFSELFDWCDEDSNFPEFICYGTSDAAFVSNNLDLATTFKEAGMLSFLYQNMYDCSDEIKAFFYVNKTISLEKLAKHFDNSLADQNHNALDDAKLLKLVYENMKTGSRNPADFREYLDSNVYPDMVRKVLRMKNGEIVEEYANIKEAVSWIGKQPNNKGAKYISNAEEKIKYASKNSSKYFDYYWRIL